MSRRNPLWWFRREGIDFELAALLRCRQSRLEQVRDLLAAGAVEEAGQIIRNHLRRREEPIPSAELQRIKRDTVDRLLELIDENRLNEAAALARRMADLETRDALWQAVRETYVALVNTEADTPERERLLARYIRLRGEQL